MNKIYSAPWVKAKAQFAFIITLSCNLACLGLSPAMAASADRLNFSKEHPVENYRLGANGQVWVHRLGDIQIVEVLLKKGCELKVNNIKEVGLPKEIYRNISQKNDALVVNGGFFGYDAKGKYISLGLVRSNGQRLNSIMPWSSGGVLVGSGKKIALLPSIHKRRAAEWSEAIQSKPIVVANDNVDVRNNLRDANFNRVSIALTKEENIYVLGVFHNFGEAMTLAEFAGVMVMLANKRHISITGALAMDGGPGAHLYVPEKNLIYGDTSPTYVPNAVSFGKCE